MFEGFTLSMIDTGEAIIRVDDPIPVESRKGDLKVGNLEAY